MKKYLFPIAFLCATLNVNAQEYLHIKSPWHGTHIPIELIDSITFGELSHADKLPAIMAQDPNISIFNEALQLTHMCDSLLEEYDYSYYNDSEEMHQGIYLHSMCYGLNIIRKGYTVFAETDSVFFANGINNIEDLKAFAAKVYDEVYPEDAGITDLTDRRNSLNRFVSYHLLDRIAAKSQLTAAGINNNRAGAVKDNYNRNC